MGTLKEKYQRFRHWQENPFDYHDSHVHHGCCNCGAESENNYCPRCGQKAVYGPITWRSVWQGIMDVWGVGTRSLPFTLWQLLWRPGYLMRDYISGKRQVSFPPVKMLVIVGIFAVIIDNWLISGETEAVAAPITSTGFNHYWDVMSNWLDNHVEWLALVAFCYCIIPVWVLFRRAPAYPRHSLPQGFFIQVFSATQFLLIGVLLLEPIAVVFSFTDDIIIGFIVTLVVPIMLLIDYKQLFGYGWWGTLWRVLMIIPFGVLIFRFVFNLFDAINIIFEQGGVVLDFWQDILIIADVLMLLWLLAEIVGVINRKSWRGLGWKAFKRPLLIAVGALLTGFACYQIGVDGAFVGLVESYIGMITS